MVGAMYYARLTRSKTFAAMMRDHHGDAFVGKPMLPSHQPAVVSTSTSISIQWAAVPVEQLATGGLPRWYQHQHSADHSSRWQWHQYAVVPASAFGRSLAAVAVASVCGGTSSISIRPTIAPAPGVASATIVVSRDGILFVPIVAVTFIVLISFFISTFTQYSSPMTA